MVTYIYKKNAHGPDACASLLKTENVSRLIVPASGALLLQQASALQLYLLPNTTMMIGFGLCFSASLVVKYCMYHMTEEFFFFFSS